MGIFSNSEVVELSESNFVSEHIKIKDCALVLFYAPWCGHCQELKETWIKLARGVTFGTVCAINADESQTTWKILKDKYDLQGYPSILSYKNGKCLGLYKQGRSIEELYKHAMDMCLVD